MKKRIALYLLVTIIGFSIKAFSQTPDSLVLKNGQTLVGSFLGWRNDDVSFYIIDAGVITVDYQKVSMIQANSGKYRVETSVRKVFYGKLTCEKPGEFVFMENGNPVSIPFKYMEIITPYKKGGSTDAYIGLGYDYAQSNDFGLFNINGGLSHGSKRWVVQGGVNSSIVYTKADGLERNRDYGRLRADRIINPHWQYSIRYIYQRNRELGLAHRHLVGTGFILNAIRKPNFHLDLSSGLAGMVERTFDDQSYSRVEIPVLLNMTIYNLGSSNLSLNHKQTLFIGMGSNKRIRHDGELELNMQLTRKLSLSTYIYDNYDSAPVQKTGTDNLDFGWNTGLKLKF